MTVFMRVEHFHVFATAGREPHMLIRWFKTEGRSALGGLRLSSLSAQTLVEETTVGTMTVFYLASPRIIFVTRSDTDSKCVLIRFHGVARYDPRVTWIPMWLRHHLYTIKSLIPNNLYETKYSRSGKVFFNNTIVYYAPRGRKGTLLMSTENTRVDKVSFLPSAYAIFYNACVISGVFCSFQIFWGFWMRKWAIFLMFKYNTHRHSCHL